MKKLFLLVLLSILLQQANATHNMAADISYTLISGSTYRITVRTFTNSNPSTTQADRCELVIYFGDGDSALAPRINGPVNQCTTADGELIATDIKKNIYETIHTYSGNGEYIISAKDPNRIAGVCNIPNSVDAPFYIQALLKIFPAYGFSNSAQHVSTPVLTDTVGIVSYYTPSTNEEDGDSLSYALVTPMSDSMPIYGYTVPDFSGSFSINAINGTVTWDAPTTVCNYVYAIEVKEWRTIGGVAYHIGSTTQEVWNQVIPYTSISEESPQLMVTVYPNPSSGKVGFSVPQTPDNKGFFLEVSNTLGEKITSVNTITNALSLENLSSGVYFYTLESSEGLIENGKFIVCE